jgi:AraC family transcriptional regulator, regulatory protein of adaptative response / methylated-DNA-[protein]-cysteine methyltransferase
MSALIDRREAATENIRFVFGTFSLGTVMVAASGKGIAAILMGDDREALRRELKGAFPHARLAENETALEGAMAKVIALLEAPPKGLDLPLDLRGSALEQVVWQALRAVRAEKPSPMARSPRPCRCPPRPRRSARPARPTCSRSPFRAIASSRRTARSRAIGGASVARGRSSSGRPQHEHREENPPVPSDSGGTSCSAVRHCFR